MNIKDSLAKMLEKDELVLWSGKPVPFKIMDKYYKPVLIRNYIIAILIIAPIIAWALVAKANNQDINANAVIIILCIILVAIPFKILSFISYRDKCNYFLTNKNIIAYLSEHQQMKLPLQDIDKIESVQQSEGTKSIRIGKAVGIPDKKNRDYALNCLANAGGEKKDFCVLFNLSEKDTKTVLELIDKYRVVA